MVKKKVLFLGVTGRIGPGLLEEYKKNYRRYYDIVIGVHKKKKIPGFKTIKIDLLNIKKLKKAMTGINVVVNLAAESNPDAKFEQIVNPNLIGAYNVFEAALESGCSRVIFASSVHAVRGYPLGEKVKSHYAPKPINFYGASKVFGEALCYVFSKKYNLSCLAIRIGAYISNDMKKAVCLIRDDLDYVISQRDIAQLIHKCIIAPERVKYGILSGSSNNKRIYLDLDFTKKLVDYNPKDDAFVMCSQIKKHNKNIIIWKKKK